jgi:hypothetical protein
MYIKKRNVANYKNLKLFAAAVVLVGELSGDTDGIDRAAVVLVEKLSGDTYPPLYFLSSNSTIVSPSFYLQYLYFCFILCVSFTPLFLCVSIGNSGSNNSALRGLFLYICMC